MEIIITLLFSLFIVGILIVAAATALLIKLIHLVDVCQEMGEIGFIDNLEK